MTDTPGLLLVHGDEPHLVDTTVEGWRRAAGATDIEILDTPATLDSLIASLVDMPLFADVRHVLVRDLPQLTGARRGGAGVEQLSRALQMRAPSTYVCFAVRATVAAGNPILAAIEAQGGKVVRHEKLRASDRRQWLEAHLRERGTRLPAGGTDLVMRCSGGDLDVMAGEVDKIAALGGSPTLADLERLVSGSEQLELYKVLDLLAGSQPAQGAALLIALVAGGRSTQYLLSILAGQLRDLLMVHALLRRGRRNPAALAADMRVPAWRAERTLRTARVIPAALAMAWMHDLQRIDAGLKAGEVDDVAALQQWGLAAADALTTRRGSARGS